MVVTWWDAFRKSNRILETETTFSWFDVPPTSYSIQFRSFVGLQHPNAKDNNNNSSNSNNSRTKDKTKITQRERTANKRKKNKSRKN